MDHPLHLEFLAAEVDVGRLPVTRAEIAFIGRSNVGKSSLLNAIADNPLLARVSAAPGRPQALGCFALDRTGATLVDCPGYGYARASKSKRETFLPMVASYLLEREQLLMVLLLVDGEIGPTASDLDMLEWLRGNGVPHAVVATKRDKVKRSQRNHRQHELAARCQLPAADVSWVSAAENVGIPQLRERIRGWLGAIPASSPPSAFTLRKSAR